MILSDKGFLGVAHLTLTSSTPAIEFAVVLKAMGISTSPTKQKIEAWKGLKSDGWLARANAGGKKVEFPEDDHQAGQTWEKTVVTQFASLLTGKEAGKYQRISTSCTPSKTTATSARTAGWKDPYLSESGLLTFYSGPCFMLCVGLLRGFGNCGKVPSDVDFASSEFWELRSKVSETGCMKKVGHKYRQGPYARFKICDSLKERGNLDEAGKCPRD